MNYYISDLHLFHKNVTREGKGFDDRPFDNLEEMHALIKEKWNAKVTNGDIVFILGDMAMRGTQEELIAFVSTLKGHKIIIRGNHNDIRDQRYKQLFDEICDYREIRDNLNGESVKLVLCHYPILMWKDQHYGSILLYGHIHNSVEEYYFKKCLREMNTEDFFDRRAGDRILRAYNVGCMMPYMDYEPRTLSEIVENYERFSKNWLVENAFWKGVSCMGKKINVRSSDEPCMFQFFKQLVHQTDKNEFYCDGDIVKYNHGVEVDFQNIEHTYEVFKLLGNYWGGWNSTPTSDAMYDITKNWEERFGAEIIEISFDSIGFRFYRKITDSEIDVLINECKKLYADANCKGGYEEMRKIIKEKSELYIWWD